MITNGITGERGGRIEEIRKYLVNVPSNDTLGVQEAHIMIGHIISEIIESVLIRK